LRYKKGFRFESVVQDVHFHIIKPQLPLSVFHQNPRIAALEDVPDTAVSAVDVLSVDTVELAHPLGEVSLGGLDHQVVVIPHLTVAVAHSVVPLTHGSELVQPSASVGIPGVDSLASTAPRSHMIKPTSQLNT